jgi:hypothetical protein
MKPAWLVGSLATVRERLANLTVLVEGRPYGGTA